MGCSTDRSLTHCTVFHKLLYVCESNAEVEKLYFTCLQLLVLLIIPLTSLYIKLFRSFHGGGFKP